ncbi:helix-turn-helix domain-containing protein [Pseudomonas sp. CC120222-01a]|uniref:helix-turn-helix domain-containing protein n=1 Tax=Pseudomonas sp. CC120222-01a TaxID=1378075 RepID=UPI000D962D63|nr:XRE family transcriptional regulator [Pseudomonas sp. CC120222-01a]PVZ41216.1 XRE family transcriptional regulator [Pseudomonas sp. CC120222-01a]
MAIEDAGSGQGHDTYKDRVMLGQEIRKLRKARAKTLAEVSEATGRSVSFISQLERGRAEIPISDLKRIALTLGVPLNWFFTSEAQPPAEVGRVVRLGERRRLGPASGGGADELLSPSVGGKFDMYICTMSPGASNGIKSAKETEEEGYVIAGELEMWIGDNCFQLGAGDSFRIAQETYRWENRGEADAVVLWVIAPPAG